MEAKFVREISANFYFPIGLSTNSEKHIIVTDTGNHVVKKLDKNGKLLFEFGRDVSKVLFSHFGLYGPLPHNPNF